MAFERAQLLRADDLEARFVGLEGLIPSGLASRLATLEARLRGEGVTPSAIGSVVTYSSTLGGPDVITARNKLLVIAGVGQSNMMRGGTVGRAISSLRFTPWPNTLVGLNGTRRSLINGDDVQGAYSASDATAFASFQDRDDSPEHQASCHLFALADMLNVPTREAVAIVGLAAGEGGESINSFFPSDFTGYNGKTNYANLIAALTAINDIAVQGYGLSVEVQMMWCQGEGRVSSPLAVSDYATYLKLLGDRWNTDIQALTGQDREVRVGIIQTAVPRSASPADYASIINQHMQCVRDRPDRFYLASTMYGVTLANSTSNSHPSADGRKFLAGPTAEALLYDAVDEGTWNGLQIAAIRPIPTTNNIRVFLRLPPGTTDITVDADRVTSVTGAGFKTVTTADPTVGASVAVTGASKTSGIAGAVDVTFGSSPGTTEMLEYALTTGDATDMYYARGLIYAESLNDNPFYTRYANAEAGGANITQKIRHYLAAERLPLASLNTRIGTQAAPELETAIGAHADLAWWISADANDCTDASTNIKDWKTRKTGAGAAVAFTQATTARQGAFNTTALLGTERSCVFTSSVTRYGQSLTPEAMKNPWTIVAMFNQDSDTSTGYIYGKHSTAGAATYGTGLYVGDSSGTPFVALKHGFSTTGQITHTQGYRRAEWCLVFASHDGAGTLRIRWNGADVSLGTVAAADISASVADSTTPCIGCQANSANTFPFHGKIRNMLMYNGPTGDLLGETTRTRMEQIEEYVRRVYRLALNG